MNVFITWSGQRSGAVAQILHDWLPDVIQRVEPFMSSEDTAKGSNWGHEITKNLRTCPVGIICLTPENLTAPWLLFEAGAISNNVEILLTQKGQEIGQPKACTYLYDLQTTDVQKPLEMFQATIAMERADNRKMLDTINESLGKDKLDNQKLDKAFEKYCPDLEKSLLAIPKPKTEATVRRSPDEMFREILTEVRSLSKNVGDQRLEIQQEIRSINPSTYTYIPSSALAAYSPSSGGYHPFLVTPDDMAEWSSLYWGALKSKPATPPTSPAPSGSDAETGSMIHEVLTTKKPEPEPPKPPKES